MTSGQGTTVELPSPPAPRNINRSALALLSVSHMFDDISQGALPVMLPFFIIAHNLSYSAAAGLVMAVTIGSSFLQPILGQFADRHSAPWLVPAGILLAGGGVALGTVMPTYLLIVLAIGLSGIGVAAFHPEGSRFANRASGSRQATGMSIFSLGGNLGFAIGPLLATTLMMNFGLHGGLLLAVPAVAMSLIMATQLSRFVPPPHPSTGKVAASRPIRPDAWGSFARLTGVVLSRSIVFYGLNTFIPLYWRDVLHQPIATGGVALTILLSSGAAGTILGGLLADKYGRRTVVLAGMAACTPLLFALVSLQDATLATMLLVPLGLALYAPMSVMVVMGQEYLPNRIGTASGVTMGLAVGVGGLSAPLLGQVADTSGMQAVLNLLVFLPLISFAFAATLPNRKLRPAS